MLVSTVLRGLVWRLIVVELWSRREPSRILAVDGCVGSIIILWAAIVIVLWATAVIAWTLISPM